MRSLLISFLISFILLLGIYSFYNVQPISATLPTCNAGDTPILIDSSDTHGTTFTSPDTDMCGGFNKVKSTCDSALEWQQKTGNQCCSELYDGDAYCAGDITPIGPFDTAFHWYCCIKATPTPPRHRQVPPPPPLLPLLLPQLLPPVQG